MAPAVFLADADFRQTRRREHKADEIKNTCIGFL